MILEPVYYTHVVNFKCLLCTKHSKLVMFPACYLEPTIEARKANAEHIVIEGCRNGLGIRIVGGRNIASDLEADFGIFVKEVIFNSLADRDGKLMRNLVF